MDDELMLRSQLEQVTRERDLALERLKDESKVANQARMAEERARESLEEIDEAIYDCLPCDDDDSPLDCVEHAADRLRELAQERDEARAERDSTKLTAMAASMAHDSIEKMIRFELRVGPEDSLHEAVQRARYERDEARAEVEKLSESAKAAWEAECVMREQRDRYHAEWKQERQEVERLRTALLEVQTSESAPAWFADGFHDGWKAGAEAMREACAAALMADGLVLSRERAAKVVRALPVPEEP